MKAPRELSPRKIKWILESSSRLAEWTIEQLQAQDDEQFDLERMYYWDEMFSRNERAIGHEIWLRLMRGRIVLASLDKDYKQVQALVAKSPGELAPFAAKVRNSKRPHGRQEHDKRTFPDWVRDLLMEADRCVARIRDLWESKLGIIYSPRPWEDLALEIAAEYCGADPWVGGLTGGQLKNWRRNKARYRRNKRRTQRSR